MPVILVVDDSKTDRALVQALLGKQPLDWVVEFAENAEEAIVALDQTAIDLVITDMMMPGMNGLQLVEFVRRQNCRTPVILMSGQGSESLAVDALQKGAASYVPKDDMAERLVETIQQVLSAQETVKSYGALLAGNVEDIQYRFRLRNDPELIPSVVQILQEMATEMGLLSNDELTRVGVAIDEAILNAIYHGNLELSARDLPEVRKRLREGERVESISSRSEIEPFSERRVHVRILLSHEAVEVTIRDDGNGFKQNIDEHESGQRGLTLIRNLVDEVCFNDVGNEIRLVKYCNREG